MTLFLMIIRKMLNTRWLVLSWLVGMLITVALVSSIPIYTNGVLQHLLMKDIESQQATSQLYPGGLYAGLTFQSPSMQAAKSPKLADSLEKYFFSQMPSLVRLPEQARYTEFDTVSLNLVPKGETLQQAQNDPNAQYVTLTSMSDLEKHITLTSGHLPALTPKNGVYEVLAPDTAISQLGLAVDETFHLSPANGPASKPITVKIVGTFSQKSNTDLYWRTALDAYNQNFFMPDAMYRQLFIDGPRHWMQFATYYIAFDYHKVMMSDIGRLSTVETILGNHLTAVMGQGAALTDFPMDQPLPQYQDKRHQLTLMVWSLDIPVLIMLAFYMFMVSRLIIDQERTEIAVLRSRGAGKLQIFLGYCIEIGILGLISFLIGPVVGLGLTEVLGASSGFLEFVSRTALPVQLTSEVYRYALYSILATLVMVMIPVLMATRQNIVSHKQQMARATGSALWHKYFLDVLFLLIAWYGWYVVQQGHKQLVTTQLNITNGLQIDPLSFFVPALFVVGVGLLALRIYPWFIRLVNWTFRRFYPPSAYIAMTQVARSSKQYQFLMIFLVMTIAIGTFSASAARTINGNLVQQLQYANGADIQLQERWESSQSSGGGGGNKPVYYKEPPFWRFSNLTDVQHAARVFEQDNVSAVAPDNTSTSSTMLMAIDPYDFAKTAWFKPSLLPYHWWGYLNLLSMNPTACLISTSLANQIGVKPGDQISVSWQGSATLHLTVYAEVAYWPSWNPYDTSAQTDTTEPPTLVVANLPYVQNTVGIQPYQVWLKLKPHASIAAVYNSMQKNNIMPLILNNVQTQIVQFKNGPFILCINGSLTLGFLIAMLVTFIGFLLYWMLTLRQRRLQFGVFRAMGLSLRNVVGMLVWEQLLSSGAACVLGGVVGYFTSKLFVNQFSLYFSAQSEVPPFAVMFNQMDAVHLYTFVVIMLLIGIGFIWWLLSRLRIAQAVKLGED